MTGSNKILTVSYGTFSCTLEGFDEPFDAMRGIAEYFRDLAADDRYFGAEPPTPDMEMLQSIAQREVNRRVEARTSETGIALTQQTKSTKAPPAAVAPQADLDSGPLTYDDEFLMSDEPEDVLTVDESIPAAEESENVETVAEKLRRIRAVVSRSIEPEEASSSFSAAPAQDVGAQAARSRAKTRTIDAIAADLADELEENAAATNIMEDTAATEEDVEDLARLDGVDKPTDNAFAEEGEVEPDSDEDSALIANVLSAEADLEPSTELGDEDASKAEERQRKSISQTDDNVDRILKETDNQFADGAGIRRRRVISQMRAAVAATKADRVLTRLLPDSENRVEESSAYRDDLKRVITRPVNMERATTPVEKAATAPKPAPLVLVSSQRVDTQPTETDAPNGDDASFPEFARKMGAEELPDLLEAAAAYTSFVEGNTHFTRPEIMRRVAAVDPALDISREAGLRSFGQLLRQGKIHKMDRGQFTIDEETRFNPGQRIAGE